MRCFSDIKSNNNYNHFHHFERIHDIYFICTFHEKSFKSLKKKNALFHVYKTSNNNYKLIVSTTLVVLVLIT